MTEKQIRDLIEQGEDQNVEFKSSLKQRQDIGATISAFANSAGGTVLIGVSDEGKVVGANIGRKTVEDLANWVKQNTDPQIYPDVKVRKANGKDIIKISVKESDEKPVFFNDRAYQRVGKTNQRISASKIRELAKQERVRLHWDERICERATLDDIDEEKITWYLTQREKIRGVKKPKGMGLETLLLNIKAAAKVRGEVTPTNAGILFFGKNPQRFVLQSQLRLARFAGEDVTRDFLDRTDCFGTLWEMLEKAEDFIRKNVRLFGFRTEFTFRRIDKLEYPLGAIREGVINALIHRSYEEPAAQEF